MKKKHKRLLIRILAAAALFGAVYAADRLLSLPAYLRVACYLVPYCVAGYDVLWRCLRNILHGQIFDECFLMTVATVGALIIGEYPESVFVMVFYQTGELFQGLAVEKSRRSISGLMALCPDTAIRLQADGTEEEILPEEAEPGDLILLRPGDKVPVDGVVEDGRGAVDTAALTGESAPRDISPGDALISGSVNLTGVIKMRATAGFEGSAVAKILSLVEDAQNRKAKSEAFITRFARVYTPCVMGAAALLALIPSLITKNPADWCYRALIFLVVSCPCALVISVPLAFFGGIGGASAQGILIKGGNYLEALSTVSAAVFDKTGTLTNGSFSVSRVLPAPGVAEDELLRTAAAAEQLSTHPIAKALAAAANGALPAAENVQEKAGAGVEATVEGKRVLAGNARLLRENGVPFTPEEAEATVVYVAADQAYLGAVILRDLPKANAGQSLAALKRLGVKKLVMLTGDRENAAKPVAGELGIDEYRAGLLPQEKAAEMKKLSEARGKNETLCFVGDGVNDAPVLTLADVGVAMGALGSDAAIEAADVVLVDDDLSRLPLAIAIAKKTRRIVRENVIFALGVKFAVLILAAFGLTNMWLGVMADVGVAILAILNSMRMLRRRKEKTGSR